MSSIVRHRTTRIGGEEPPLANAYAGRHGFRIQTVGPQIVLQTPLQHARQGQARRALIEHSESPWLSVVGGRSATGCLQDALQDLLGDRLRGELPDRGTFLHQTIEAGGLAAHPVLLTRSGRMRKMTRGVSTGHG